MTTIRGLAGFLLGFADATANSGFFVEHEMYHDFSIVVLAYSDTGLE